MQTLKSIAVGALFLASTAGAASVEKTLFGTPRATCSCKGKGDCTCPRGQCKCKSCGNNKARVFDALKGSSETTQLPDTARLDARGGVFL